MTFENRETTNPNRKNFTSSVIKIWITAVGSYFIGNYLGKLLKSNDISF